MEDLGEGVRERIGGERLAADGRSLEQRQSLEPALEPGSIRRDDAIALDREPHEREIFPARGVADDFDHGGQRSATVRADPPRVGLHNGEPTSP